MQPAVKPRSTLLGHRVATFAFALVAQTVSDRTTARLAKSDLMTAYFAIGVLVVFGCPSSGGGC
jgi:hypothetical protein